MCLDDIFLELIDQYDKNKKETSVPRREFEEAIQRNKYNLSNTSFYLLIVCYYLTNIYPLYIHIYLLCLTV